MPSEAKSTAGSGAGVKHSNTTKTPRRFLLDLAALLTAGIAPQPGQAYRAPKALST